MNRCILLLTLVISKLGFAQQTELNLTGQFNFQTFRGNASVETTFVNKHSIHDQGYANDRFGKEAGIGYGISFTLQRITKWGLVFGINAGPDLLKNQIKIDWIYTTSGRVPAKGKVSFTSHYLNASPFIGYRIKLGNSFSMDIDGMLEFCVPTFNRKGSGEAVSQDGSLRVPISNTEGRTFDLRKGFLLTLNRKNYSLLAGWSSGDVNHTSSYRGSIEEAYSNVIKLGIRYKWISQGSKTVKQ